MSWPHFSPELEQAITTPREYEPAGDRPLWIIWKHIIANDGLADAPQIDCICDSEEATRANLLPLLKDAEYVRNRPCGGEIRVYVERVIANHRLAASMADAFQDHTLTQVKAHLRRRRSESWSYLRDGD